MPLPGFGNSQVDPGLLGGVNSMQYGAGLMPGGLPQPGQFQTPQFPPPFVMPMAPAQFGSGVSPYARPMGAFAPIGVQFPFGSAFGSDHRMQQQRSQGFGFQMGSYAQTGAGVAARVGGGLGAWAGGAALGAKMGAFAGPMGAAIGGFAGGVAGALGFEGSGLGEFSQRMGEGIMAPFHAGAMRAAQLQTSSLGHVRSGSDLGFGGAGLGMGASRGLQNQLMNVADSRQFQRDTGARFNRQDVMRITQLAGDMGMLDQAQTATEISQSVTKISKALSNIMKIAGEPDVRNAMKMMSQLRSTGMSVAESQTAVQNARTFARMAGTSIQDVMASGMQGAGMFQQQGMTAASGLGAGMAAAGMAGMAAGALSPRQMALFGGREGIQQNLTGGAAAAGSLDVMMMSMVSRQGGQLAIDPKRMQAMLGGRTGLGQAIGQTAINFNDPNAIQEFSFRRGDLRDQMQRMMGPQASVLLPMMQAIQVAKSIPGMSLGGAFRTLGMDEQQANTFQTLARSKEFWSGVRQQIDESKVQAQRDRAHQREMIKDAAAEFKWTDSVGRGISETFRGIGDSVNEFRRGLDEDSEAEAAAESRGGGLGVLRLARAGRSQSKLLNARARDALRAGTPADFNQLLQGGTASMRQQQAAQQTQETASASNWFQGPEGFGFTQAGRGGLTNVDLVKGQMDTFERAGYFAGTAMSANTARAISNRRAGFGQQLDAAFTAGSSDLVKFSAVAATKLRGSTTKLGTKVDDSKYADFEARAAARVTQNAASKRDKFSSNEKYERTDLEKDILAAADEAGIDIKDPQVRARLLSAETRQAVLGSAAEGAPAETREVLEESRQRAGEIVSRDNIEQIALSRKAADTKIETSLKSLGLKGGFGKSSALDRESVAALSEIVAGGTTGEQGKETEIRQKLLRIKSIEERASRSIGARQRELFAQAKSLRATLRSDKQYTSEQLAAQENAVELSLNKLDADKRKDILNQLGSMTAEQLTSAGKEITTAAQQKLVSSGMESQLGADLSKKFTEGLGSTGDFQKGLAAVVQSPDFEKRITSESERKLYRSAAAGNAKALSQLRGKFMEGADETTKMAAGAGLTSTQEAKTPLENIIDEIQTTAQSMGTDQFTVSVGKFSEASSVLLEAATSLRDSSVSGFLGGLLGGGDPKPKENT